MWTAQNRDRYDRTKLRYPSDLTDDEWRLLKPLIPPSKRGGNKRTVDVREVVNGIMYVLSTGCQWAALSKDLPPRSTVNAYLVRWREDRTLDRLHQALYVATLFGLYPFVQKLFADGGYQGSVFEAGLRRICRQIKVEIVKRSDAGGFVVLPKRWIVERTIAWLNRCRRLAKEWERLDHNALTFLRRASIRLMVRKLCQT